ncbi:hypothetical protein JCM3765_002496 [Sporobolomyces pararoseus]
MLEQANMYTIEELTDRLVVSTEEQDVLYLIVWIQEIKQLGRLEALNGTHSWKGCSALVSLVRSEWSTLRQLSLEILLAAGAEITNQVRSAAMEHGRIEAIETLSNWKTGGETKVNDARMLLSISIEDAADWIDQNLPLPPDVENLTGYGPLPDPRTTHVVPSEFLEKGSRKRNNWVEDQEDAKIDSTTQPSLQPIRSNTSSSSSTTPIGASKLDISVTSSTSRSPPSVPVSFVSSQSSGSPPQSSTSFSGTDNSSNAFDLHDAIRLNVAYFPIGFSRSDLGKLFTNFGIACRVILCRSERLPAYAFVDVQTKDVDRALKFVHKKRLGSLSIRCIVATSWIDPETERRFAAAALTFFPPTPPTQPEFVLPRRTSSSSGVSSPRRRSLISLKQRSRTSSSHAAPSPYASKSPIILFFHLPLSPDHPHTKTIASSVREYELLEVVEEKETVLKPMLHCSFARLVILFLTWATLVVSRPIKFIPVVLSKRTPQNGGIFVPHPRPGHPGPVITDTDGGVFSPTPTAPGKILKNPKITGVRNPKKGGN